MSTSPLVFDGVNKTTCTLYVPYGSKAAYQAADQWKDFLHIEEAPGLTLSATNVSASGNGGTNTIDVTSNTSWTTSSNQTWLTVSPATTANGNGKLLLTSLANLTLSTRSAIVTVSAPGLSPQTITVTQEKGSASLTVSATTVELANGAGSNATIGVASNINWSAAADQTWITLSPASASGSGTLKITATANPNLASRTATITISATGLSPQTVTVTQAAGLPAFEVTATTVGLTKEEGSNAKIPVTSNITWTASSDQEWLTISPAVATKGNGTITVTAVANPAPTTRSATVTVTAEGVASKKINIVQAANFTLQVSSLNISVGKEAGSTASAEVVSNTTWTAGANQDWLSVAPTVPTMGNGNVTITATANPMAITRTAKVFISATGATTQTITLTQAAGSASLSLSSTTVNIGKDAESKATATVSSNTTWASSSDQTWLTVAPAVPTTGNGELLFTATANPTLTTRKATVTVTGTGVSSQNITVVQAAGTGIVLVSSNNVSIGKEQGSTASVFVTANAEWTAASDQKWLLVNPTTGSGNGILVFNADANPTALAREALVTLAANGQTLQTIKVTQVGAVAQNYLKLSAIEANMANGAGTSQAVTVEANISWTASSNQEWLTLNRTSGTGNAALSFTLTANTTTTARVAKVTVSATGIEAQTVTVIQAAGDPTISASPKESNISKEDGSMVYVDVVSNTTWSATIDQPWLKATPGSPLTGNKKLTLTALANPTVEERKATVTLSTSDGSASQTVTVTQKAGSPTLQLTGEAVFVNKEEGSSTSTDIVSNSPWTAASNQNWLTVTSSGIGNGTLSITAKANSNSDERIATVTVSVNGIPSQTVRVTQAGNLVLSVSSNTISVAKEEGSTASLALTSNATWSVKLEQDWLSVSPGTGNGNGILIFRAQANPTFAERSANVVIWAKGISQTVQVTQVAGMPYLAISSNALILNKEENSTSSVEISSNTKWTAVSNEKWLTVSPTGETTGNGKLTFVALSNNLSSLRTATVTVSGTGIANQTVTVMQSAGESFISLSATKLDIAKEASNATIVEVASNTSWVVTSDQPWLSVAPNASAGGSGKITLTATENPSIEKRTATLTFSATGTTAKSIVVTQAAGNPFLKTSASAFALENTEGTTVVAEVSSNTKWTATSDQPWLVAAIVGSGNGNGQVSFKAGANPTTKSRSATVTLSATGVDNVSIQFTQKAGSTTLALSSSMVVLEESGKNTSTVKVLTNGTWTATTDQDWLVLETNTGTGDGGLVIKADKNMTTSDREAKVLVKVEGGPSETVTVTQKVGAEYLSLSSSAITFNAKGANKEVVAVTSNTNWIASSKAQWLSVSPNTATSGNGEIELVAEPNTGEARTAEVTILSLVSVQTITVTQEGTTGIEPTLEESLSVYPNPVIDILKTSGFDGKAGIVVTDINGRKVIEAKVGKDEPVQMGHLRKGVYWVKMTTNQNVMVRKIVKD